MMEMLLILAAIFVAYVFYGAGKNPHPVESQSVNQAKPEQPVAFVKPATVRPVSNSAKAPAKKSVVAASPRPKPVAASAPKPASAPQKAGKRGLKDPKTGEVATSYSNYRFTKRWIKEALVAEGFLDKVYKNDELNADIEASIKSALIKLEALKQYRA